MKLILKIPLNKKYDNSKDIGINWQMDVKFVPFE